MKLRLRFLLALLGLLLVFGVPELAQAQSISISDRGFRIRRLNDRPTNQQPDDVSRQDCLDDNPDEEDYDFETGRGGRTYLEFALNFEGAKSNSVIEIWASLTADCLDRDERQGGGNCHLVYRSSALTNRVHEAHVYPRVVVSRTNADIYRPEDVIGGAGDTEYLGPDTCDRRIDEPFTFYVMMVSGDSIDASDTWEGTRVDTAAPLPPTSLDIGTGDQNLFLDWNVPVENEEPDADGYAFYCVPTQGDGTQMDGLAGASAGAGCDDGGILVPGDLPSVDAEDYQCGRVRGRSTREGTASKVQGQPLVNGVTYAVAIASRDTIDNRGQLSDVVCGTPEEVITFFERYKEAGGRGGGGFCSAGRQPHHILLWLAGCSAVFWFLRRKGSLRS